MGIKAVYPAFALGVAVGIVTAVALSDPRLTAGFLIVCLLIIAAGAVASVRVSRRREEAIRAFDSQSDAGLVLRKRAFEEPPTLSLDEDKAYWWDQLNGWDRESHKIIHMHADGWHSTYNTWRVESLFYTALPNQGRSTMIDNLDARLRALAAIRTHL